MGGACAFGACYMNCKLLGFCFSIESYIPLKMGKSKKIKPWSISTTMRNPARARSFLRVLAQMEGREWDNEAKMEFQTRLIQNRLFGYGSAQFYDSLSESDKALLENTKKKIPLAEAKRIFVEKGYKDPPMRGRTSYKPLEKFGFANHAIGKKIAITSSGIALLEEITEMSELFTKSFIKWQLPNPQDKRGFPAKHGYNIKPFIGVLHLIREVNRLCKINKTKAKGISLWEFKVFGVTLINYQKIKDTAKEIIKFREMVKKNSSRDDQIYNNDTIEKLRPDFDIDNLHDYADNALRYFRTTKLIHLRGGNRYIDLEPLRRIEIDTLLDSQTGEANIPASDYVQEIGDVTKPILPWETTKYIQKAAEIVKKSINEQGGTVQHAPDFDNISLQEQKEYLKRLRKEAIIEKRKQEKTEMQSPEKIQEIIKQLEILADRKKAKEIPNKPVLLEYLINLGMVALNDAKKIEPNYPVGDDNTPSFTAPAGKPDIECYYENFSLICEVTMLRTRDQWYNEGQPVLRHLDDFEKDRKEDCFCLFIAPYIHQDTANTFLFSVKHSYENKKRLIVPLTIKEFSEILSFCANRLEEGNPLSRNELKDIFLSISAEAEALESGKDWCNAVPKLLSQWFQEASR